LDALKDSVDRLEDWHRQMAARLAVFTEHAEPSPELATELSLLSARLGALAASAGQLAADAAQAATRMQR
jgi:hypothetical protein